MSNAFRIFKLFGITVYVHWGWLIVVMFLVSDKRRYDNHIWALADVLTLFGIVLLHEFGHSLACKSVGGKAETIMLWPLGGVAMVKPPQRAGALLWSVAAGPLVNVLLMPVTIVLFAVFVGDTKSGDFSNFQWYIASMMFINIGLLIFNIMPVYPLDGGQILQAILWFFIGRAKSLYVASVVGLVLGGLIGLLALTYRDYWMVMLALFIVFQAWRGFKMARVLIEYEKRGIDPFAGY